MPSLRSLCLLANAQKIKNRGSWQFTRMRYGAPAADVRDWPGQVRTPLEWMLTNVVPR